MEEHEEINYKTLRKLQQAEQTSSILTKVNVNFYQDLFLYMATLERSIENEKNTLKLKLFTDEIQNIRKIATSIYELREKKIVLGALATARGATLDLTNFLEIEKKLFNALIGQIKNTRKEIFEEGANQSPKKQPTPPIAPPSKRELQTNPVVCVLEDTPEFIGTDGKTYLLQKEDLITIPDEMIEPLLKKKIVKKIK